MNEQEPSETTTLPAATTATDDDATTNNTIGYVHVYTGNGKGKTTAAFGLAIRALMAGKRVFVGQFVKSMKYHETKIVEALATSPYHQHLRIEQFGNGCFIYQHDPTPDDIHMAVAGFKKCERILARENHKNHNESQDNCNYDLVILDEITIALKYNLLDVETVVGAIRNRHPAIEVVITGRYAPQELIDIGDVVTEMKEIKHYFKTKGVLARDGIER